MAKKSASKPEATGTKNLVPLPDLDDGKPDEGLVNETVEWIRNKIVTTVFRGTFEIGDHVFRKFFDSDPKELHSKNPKKNASLRALYERCGTDELPTLSRSALQRAVSTAAMVHELGPETAFAKLYPSQQAALLPMREAKTIETLAVAATEKKLSVREIRDLVTTKKKAASAGKKRRGAPEKSEVLKAIDRSFKGFGKKTTFTSAEVKLLKPEDAKAALKKAEDLSGWVSKLIGQLKKS